MVFCGGGPSLATAHPRWWRDQRRNQLISGRASGAMFEDVRSVRLPVAYRKLHGSIFREFFVSTVSCDQLEAVKSHRRVLSSTGEDRRTTLRRLDEGQGCS